MKKLIVLVFVVMLLSAALMVSAVSAAPPLQEGGQEYTVQADDWLSKLAEKNYGDVLAWPVIWKATVAKAAEDDSFAVITDPNVIEVGQKLWIPDEAQAAVLLEEFACRAVSRFNGRLCRYYRRIEPALRG